MSGDCARLRFIRYCAKVGSGVRVGVFKFVELGPTYCISNLYSTEGFLAAIPRYGSAQPIVGFPGWPFMASMAKDVVLRENEVEGGVVIRDRAEIYPDGSLDPQSAINEDVTIVDPLMESAPQFYRALVEKGYLTPDDPMYDEIRHLL